MNSEFEAAIVIGALAICFGLVLAIPGLWWARRKSRAIGQQAMGGMSVTPFGFLFAIVFAAIIFGAFSLQYLMPGLSGVAYSVIMASVLMLGVVGEKLAKKLGLEIVVKKEDDNDNE